LTFICSQPHDIDLLFGLPSWLVFLHLASPCNLYPVQIHFYHNFIVHNFALPYCFDSQRPVSYWVANISSFVAWIHGWCVVNICLNSDHLFLDCWLLFYDIQQYSFRCQQYLNYWTFIAHLSWHYPCKYLWVMYLIHQLVLPSYCFIICYPQFVIGILDWWSNSSRLSHLVVNLPSLLSYVPFNLITHSYVYSLFHWINYIRSSHLASCYLCYFSWFKMPFIRNSFPDLLLYQLFLFIPFCQQFVHWSLILNIVSLAQHAFSYSLSIDLSL